MTDAPDLHALANMPGAGKAFEALAKAGFTGEDPTAPLWRVTLYATQLMAAAVMVRAETEMQAEAMAMEKAEAAHGRPDLLHWEAIEAPSIDGAGDVDPVEDDQ